MTPCIACIGLFSCRENESKRPTTRSRWWSENTDFVSLHSVRVVGENNTSDRQPAIGIGGQNNASDSGIGLVFVSLRFL